MGSTPPKSVMIIGGGFIGSEIGSFFAGVGVQTSLFVRGDGLLAREDADIEEVFTAEFTKNIETHFNSELADLTHDGSEFTATFTVDGEPQSFTAERVVFAIGRKPNTADLDLEQTGLAANARGFLPVDENLETAVEGIYALGDVNGRYMLQHAATYEASYLQKRLIDGAQGPIDDLKIPHAVFSRPEIAGVGATEQELKDAGTPYVAVFGNWAASARAWSARVDYQRTKLLVSSADYSILGCHFIGPEASTMLHQILMLIHLDNDVRELTTTVYIHPALNEVVLAAARSAVAKVAEHNAGEDNNKES